MKKEEKNALVRAEQNLPTFLQNNAIGGRGKENISKDDLTLPRVILLQPLSPQVNEDGKQAGDMINSITDDIYGKEIKIIPINHFKSRMHWRPREYGGGIVCSARNGIYPTQVVEAEDGGQTGPTCAECKYKDWNNEAEGRDKAPKCTQYYNFTVLIEGFDSPVVLTMERTKIKAARKLLSLAAYTGGNLDIFAKKYRLSSIIEKKDGKSWYNYKVEPIGFVTETEYRLAENIYASLRDVVVNVEQEHPETE